MTTGKTVLLVEDEQRLWEIISDYFRNEGFEVAGAEDIGTVIRVGYKFEE